jgi:signal transduction histidine kinase
MSQRGPLQKPDIGETASLASVLHNCLSAGVVILDAREQILCCSPEAARLLRLPPDQTVDCDLSVLPAPLQKLAQEVAGSGRAAGPLVVTLAGKGSPAFRVSAVPFRTSAGQTQVAITLHDDMLAHRLEQNLDRLDRLAGIGTLSAGMAHEIKNAFVAVRTFVDLLLEKNPDAELGDVVRRELRRIDTIVSQMLRFRTPARPNFTVVRVHDVLDHSLRLLQHQFDAKLITLNRTFSASLDAVKGDDYQLEQAFVNLFFNALEAMGPSGTLSVTTDTIEPAGQNRALPQVRVTIADDGIGISPENMSRLFEPFFTTKQNGTGLGMAITRRIIREHHGDITAQSEPNRGTTFQVWLPTHAAGPA